MNEELLLSSFNSLVNEYNIHYKRVKDIDKYIEFANECINSETAKYDKYLGYNHKNLVNEWINYCINLAKFELLLAQNDLYGICSNLIETRVTIMENTCHKVTLPFDDDEINHLKISVNIPENSKINEAKLAVEDESFKREEDEISKKEDDEILKKEEQERFKKEDERIKKEEDERLKKEEDEILKREEDEILKKEEDERLMREEDEILKKGEDERLKKEELERFKRDDSINLIPQSFNNDNTNTLDHLTLARSKGPKRSKRASRQSLIIRLSFKKEEEKKKNEEFEKNLKNNNTSSYSNDEQVNNEEVKPKNIPKGGIKLPGFNPMLMGDLKNNPLFNKKRT